MYDSEWGFAFGQAAIDGLIEGLISGGRFPSPSPRRRAQAYLNTRRTDRRRAWRRDRFVSVRSYMADVVARAWAVKCHEEDEEE